MRSRRTLSWLATAALALGFAGVALAAPKVGEAVTVRVLSAKVMQAPRFVGASSGAVSRGDTLTVREIKGPWYRVEGRTTGWIHKTNVVEGRVELSARPGGGGSGGASREEVELAGRGFTPEVESQYRDKNPTLDFRHVDGIEQTDVDSEGLEDFVREGMLSVGGAP